MPALTGIDLAQLLKKRAATKDVAIILYSSLETSELQSQARARPAQLARSRSRPARHELLDAFERLVSRAGDISRRGKAI